MAVTDSISDIFTKIRNSIRATHDEVHIQFSRMAESIVGILKDEGFIRQYEILEKDGRKAIRVVLKYAKTGDCVMSELTRISRPSNRVYVHKSEIPKPMSGFGIVILSTSKGVMTGRAARSANLGGELIGEIY